MFEAMGRIVLAGIQLTLVRDFGNTESPRSGMLEDEEVHLAAVLQHWMPFGDVPPPMEFDIKFITPGEQACFVDKHLESAKPDSEGVTEDGTQASLKSAITTDLRRMQGYLADLIDSWEQPTEP